MKSPPTVLKIDPTTYTTNMAHAYSELPGIVAALSFAGGDKLERTTSILSGNWKFTAQLRESRSGELEFWLYRYLTAPPPHSDDMLSEVEELPPAVAVTCLFNWGSFAATTLNSASNGAGHSVTSSLIFAIFGWQN